MCLAGRFCHLHARAHVLPEHGVDQPLENPYCGAPFSLLVPAVSDRRKYATIGDRRYSVIVCPKEAS